MKGLESMIMGPSSNAGGNERISARRGNRCNEIVTNFS